MDALGAEVVMLLVVSMQGGLKGWGGKAAPHVKREQDEPFATMSAVLLY